jgi:hypothetical protein
MMVPLPFTEEGLKLADTPAGRPVAVIETAPVKPNNEATLMEAVGFEPGVIVTAAGGAAVMVKSGRPTTVRLMGKLWVSVPLVPVMFTVAAPTVAVAEAVNVSVLIAAPVTEAGLKDAVTPAGNPLTLKATVPPKLFTGRTVTLVVAVVACITLVPLAEIEKSGVVLAGTTGNEFWIFWMNSAVKKLPAGGEFAIDPVKVFPARGFVCAGSQLGSAWAAPS